MSRTDSSVQRVGAWTLTLLRLATFRVRRGRLVPEVESAETVSFPSNVLLCRRGDETILVDAGEGAIGRPPGIPSSQEDEITLEEALHGAGCRIEDVGLVVVTHLDFDHANGVVTGSRGALTPTFPTASVVFPNGAIEYAESDRRQRAEMDAGIVLDALHASSSEVRVVGDGAEVAPGMRFLFVPGHREVHAAIEIREASERFFYLADVFHLPEEIEQPERPHGTDVDADPSQAVETRVRMLAAIGSRDLVAGSHLEGFGHVEMNGDVRVWRPVV